MARTQVAVEQISNVGLKPTQTPVFVDGHSFINDGSKTFIRIINGSTAMVLTFQTPVTVEGLAVDDRTVSVGADEQFDIGPFAKGVYNQGGEVFIDYDDVTDGAIEVVRLP